MTSALELENRLGPLERLVERRTVTGESGIALRLALRFLEQVTLDQLSFEQLARLARVVLAPVATNGDLRTTLLQTESHVLATFITALDLRVATAGPAYALEGAVLNQLAHRLREVYGQPTPSLPEDDPVELSNRALVYKRQGRYAEAEPLYHRALARFAAGSPEAAMITNNLGQLYLLVGRVDDARAMLHRALEIRRSCYGDAHPLVLASLNNIAGCERETGGAAGALGPLWEAYAILEAASSPELSASPQAADILHNLGGSLLETGQDHDAAPLLERAVKANSLTLGDQHPRTLQSRVLFAKATGVTSAALSDEYRTRVRALRGSDDSEVTTHELYVVFGQIQRGQIAEARSALAGIATAHTDQATREEIEDAWGMIAHREGDYSTALVAYERALARMPAHVDGGRSALLSQIGAMRALVDDVAGALDAFEQSIQLDDRHVVAFFAASSEPQRDRFAATRSATFNFWLALASAMPATEGARRILEFSLRRKGMVAESARVRMYANLRSATNGEKLAELATLRAEIANRRFTGDTASDVLSALETRRTLLEVGLAPMPPQHDAVAVEELVGALPSNTALVDFLWYEQVDFAAGRTNGDSRYLALVVRPSAEPIMFDLGPASQIDGIVVALRRTVSSHAALRDIEVHPPVDPGVVLRLGQRLYEHIFAPLHDALRGVERLVISPEGKLALVPLAILPTPDGTTLIDHYEISYVDSARECVRPPAFEATSRGSVVVADPDYQLGASASEPRFSVLPGARSEGAAVSRLIGAQLWMGSDATVERVRRVRSPKILHFATHGFHAPRASETAVDEFARKIFHLSPPTAAPAWRVALERLDDPMLRAGLALAGADRCLAGLSLDGILTADAVAGMDLSETQLVVLSACATGVGDAAAFNGVSGLRRSFAIAGARAQIVSLWPVGDAATRELMVGFYERLLAGAELNEALRRAQQAIRVDFPHPRDWGAFVCFGR